MENRAFFQPLADAFVVVGASSQRHLEPLAPEEGMYWTLSSVTLSSTTPPLCWPVSTSSPLGPVSFSLISLSLPSSLSFSLLVGDSLLLLDKPTSVLFVCRFDSFISHLPHPMLRLPILSVCWLTFLAHDLPPLSPPLRTLSLRVSPSVKYQSTSFTPAHLLGLSPCYTPLALLSL